MQRFAGRCNSSRYRSSRLRSVLKECSITRCRVLASRVECDGICERDITPPSLHLYGFPYVIIIIIIRVINDGDGLLAH